MAATFTVTDKRAVTDTVAPMTRQVSTGVAADAASGTPVDTGRLARGWRVELDEGSRWLVVNEVPYARFVEYGTSRQAAAAMLGRAVAEARARYG